MNTNKRNRIGSENPVFINGKTISHGYVVLTSKIWGENRGRYEHRVIMEQKLGRPLLPTEVVHHKNGDKADNRPENLELMPSRAVHNREHGLGKLLRCEACGKERWYGPALLSRFKGGLAQYKCRPCALRSLYKKACLRCGGTFVGRMPARYCCKCTTKSRSKKV